MKQPTVIMLLTALLLLCCPAQAKKNKCKGSLAVDSIAADTIEEYSNRVKVFIPVKIKVSNSLLKCADEIWIETIDSNNIRFVGPANNKTGKLLDHRFKRIKTTTGIFKTALIDSQTQLWIKLTHYSFFPAGHYNGKIKVSVVSDNTVVDEQLIDMTYYSAPKISISLDNNSRAKVSGNNGNYQIDLGELVNNARFDWGIKVLSNSAYDIVLDSEYNGLRHETNTSALIGYTVGFDGVKIPSSEQLTKRYDFAASVKNTWFGFSFVLGNVDLMPAGNYQDNLSLTIYPH